MEILTFKVTLSEQKQAKLAFWPFLILHKIVFFPSHTSILAEITHVYAYIHISKFHTCQSSRFRKKMVQSYEQGRIHGHQLRMGGQGRKNAFFHFSTWAWQINRPTDRQTDKASYRVACQHVISNRDTIGKWRKWLNVSCLGVKVFCLFILYLVFIHSPWVVYCISIRGMSVRLSACPLIRVAQSSSLTNTHIRWKKDLSSSPYLAHLI